MKKLKEFCEVCNSFDDSFIGLRFVDGYPLVSFPRGYRKSEKDDDVRKDILSLLTILHKFTDKREGNGINDLNGDKYTQFPILSYQYIIYDYLSNGYYTEKDVDYRVGNRGKVNWKRTIQKIKPMIDDDNVVYLDFVVKRSINKTDIITKIHEYCVYESFSKLGWLYFNNTFIPKKPSIQVNKKMFLTELNDALSNTYNSNKKKLFSCMIDIINQVDEKTGISELSYGVTKFEHVWEKLVDYIFGEDNKSDYFPHGHYTIIKDGEFVQSSALEPDTIMKLNDRLFILDAKYYKYGIINNPSFLPPTSSIHKQITYGEFVAEKQFVEKEKIYNAFILPFESKDNNKYKFVSVATGDWIKYNNQTLNYNYVLAILVDTKYIMDTYSRHNIDEIYKMSQFIEKSLECYRNSEND